MGGWYGEAWGAVGINKEFDFDCYVYEACSVFSWRCCVGRYVNLMSGRDGTGNTTLEVVSGEMVQAVQCCDRLSKILYSRMGASI